MDNVEDMDGFEIDTSKSIYVFILFVVCINCLFIFSMLKKHFVMNGIVQIFIGLPNTYGEGSKHRCVG